MGKDIECSDLEKSASGLDVLEKLNNIKDSNERISFLEKVVSGCDDIDYFVKLGDEYREVFRYDDAGKMYEKALSICGENVKANYGLALVCYRLNRREDALKYIKKAVEGCEDKDGLSLMGMILGDNGSSVDSIECKKKAIEKDPNDGQLYASLAITYFRAGMKDEGNTALELALKHKNENSYYYHDVGAAYYQKRKFSKAKEFFKKALAIKKTPNTLNYLGNTYREMAMWKEARESYVEAYELSKYGEDYNKLNEKIDSLIESRANSNAGIGFITGGIAGGGVVGSILYPIGGGGVAGVGGIVSATVIGVLSGLLVYGLSKKSKPKEEKKDENNIKLNSFSK